MACVWTRSSVMHDVGVSTARTARGRRSTLYGTLYGSRGHTAPFVIAHKLLRGSTYSFSIAPTDGGRRMPDFGIFEALKLHNNGEKQLTRHG